jgi:hypothetical protein
MKYIFVLLFFYLLSPKMEASHNMGGDITYTCLGGNQYRFSMSYYRDCSGISAPTSINFNITSASCGQTLSLTGAQVSATEATPVCPSQLSQTTCNGGTLQGVEVYVYEGVITLPAACTDWVVSYSDCCRNAAITNSTGTSFYIEALLNNLDAPCNNSPSFTSLPVPYICAGQVMNYNHGAVDVEGDSLVYTMVDPMQSATTFVTFNAGLSATQPLNTTPANGMVFDPASGQMTFTPNAGQVAVAAVLVQEYRNGVLIGSIIRDMQIVVINCTNNTPAVAPPAAVVGGTNTNNNFFTCEGNTLEFSIIANDIDLADNLSLTETVTANLPGATLTTVGSNPMTVNVSWPVPPGANSLYSFTLRFEDNACPILGYQVLGYTVSLPSVRADGPAEYCPPSENIALSGIGSSAGGSYSWSPAAGLSCTNCANPNASVSAPTTYTVTYTDPSGCTATDNITIDEHIMNLTVNNVPADWCVGDPAFSMLAELNGDPGTTITPSTTLYDVNSIPYANIPITGTLVSLSDDQVSGALPIGFSFDFFGNTYTNFHIGSNGFITFSTNTSSGCCSGQNLPTTTFPNDLIALFWEDLDPGNGGQPAINEIRYATVGTAPNRTLIVEWDAVDHFSSGDNVTGQIHLHEGTNCIETHVQTQPATCCNHTLGIENATGTIGYSPAGFNAASWTVNSPIAFEFCPGNDTVGTGITYLWSPGGGVSDVNAQEPTFNPPASPTSYDVTADDGTCQITEAVNITCTLLGADCEEFTIGLHPNNDKVLLNWTTAAEEENAGFFIERSEDGVNYVRLNWVASLGNTTEGHQYAYNDDENLIKGSRYYYRLIQMDQDGTEHQFCEVKTLEIPGEFVNNLSIQPNPTKGEVVLIFDAEEDGQVQVRVFDVLGQMVLDAGQFNVQAGNNRYPLSIQELAPATYFIQLGDEELGYKAIERVVKTK